MRVVRSGGARRRNGPLLPLGQNPLHPHSHNHVGVLEQGFDGLPPSLIADGFQRGGGGQPDKPIGVLGHVDQRIDRRRALDAAQSQHRALTDVFILVAKRSDQSRDGRLPEFHQRLNRVVLEFVASELEHQGIKNPFVSDLAERQDGVFADVPIPQQFDEQFDGRRADLRDRLDGGFPHLPIAVAQRLGQRLDATLVAHFAEGDHRLAAHHPVRIAEQVDLDVDLVLDPLFFEPRDFFRADGVFADARLPQVHRINRINRRSIPPLVPDRKVGRGRVIGHVGRLVCRMVREIPFHRIRWASPLRFRGWSTQ
ncbi:protein of unknown function [Candidatus Nitrospira inopinata]|uniref:Uncharacterized protein n=1 Tax=Candidatus Nitrospira inopinata TaxID=1715989 RepID=A0A0S4KU17_9BACT|nr:protein of unknown function [Candidatus Nitrospira inopinata]